MTGWKKYAALFGMAALVMCMGVSQTGCSGRERENTETDDGKISVVTTIFPPYDFVREIAGDQVEVKTRAVCPETRVTSAPRSIAASATA